MATNLTLQKYKDLANQLQADLYSTPGISSPGSVPSSSDVQKEAQFIKTKAGLQRVLSEQRADDWYRTPSLAATKKESKREGLVSRIINILSTPLYGIVGAAETALGKGTKKGLIKNIKSNIQERGLFGDLLRSYNAPKALSIPLGFALDVMFDPVNWTIAGPAALIPKIVKGAASAGVRGAELGVKAGLAQRAATIGKYTPFVKGTEKYQKFADEAVRLSAELGVKAGLAQRAATIGKYTPFVKGTEKYQKFADEAVRLSDDYYKAINSSVEDVLRKTIDNPDWRRKAAESMEEFLNRSKKGQEVLKLTKYSHKDWWAATKARSAEEAEWMENIRKVMKGEKVEEVMIPVSGEKALVSPFLEAMGTKVVRGPGEEIIEIIVEMDAAKDIASGGYKAARVDDWSEVGRRLTGEKEIDDLVKGEVRERMIKVMREADEAGLSSLEKSLNKFSEIFRTKLKIGDVNVGEKIADAYNIFISTFRGAVIGLSPATYVRATVGNLAFAQMAGINVTNPLFLKYVKGTWNIVRGKAGAFEKQILKTFNEDKNFAEFIKSYPGAFSRVFGYHPALLKGRYGMEHVADNVIDVIKKQGKNIDMNILGKERGEAMAALDRSLRALEGGGGEMRTLRKKIGGAASQIAKEGGIIPGQVGGTTLISQEIYQGAFRRMVNDLAAKGAAGNKVAQGMYKYFTKPMDAYELIDQSYKLGTTLYLAQVGVSRREVEMLKNFIKLAPEDLVRIPGKDLYKFLPDASIGSAGEIYMNYGAMPGAVKILRTLPLMGAPFVSFLYAAAVKLGKTLAYNPAVFNKINFILQEISGPRTPLEKEALKSPYYSYLNQPGVLKLNSLFPFFGDNPVYLNAVNLLPYYTLNIFQPSERDYLDPKMKARCGGII